MPRIASLTPAPEGLRAVFFEDATSPGGPLTAGLRAERVVAMALLENGAIDPVVLDEEGDAVPVDDPDYLGLCWEDDSVSKAAYLQEAAAKLTRHHGQKG